MNLLADAPEGCPACESRRVTRRFHPQDEQETAPLYQCGHCGEEWMVAMKMTRAGMLSWLPMCAASFKPQYVSLLDSPQHVLEVKENGDRALLVFRPSGGQLFTRTLSKADGLPVEKTDWVPHLTRLRPDCDSCILDGEITVSGAHTNHSDVAERFGCGVEKSLERQRERGLLRFTCWDVLEVDGTDLRERTLRERLRVRDRLVQSLRSGSGRICLSYVNVVRTKPAEMSGRAFVDGLLAQGYEGAILKRLDAPYHSDKRPAGVWVKIKEEDECDLYITGFEEAREISKKSDGTVSATKYKGLIGSLKLSAWDGRKDVFVCDCSGMDDATRKAISANRSAYLRRVLRCECQRVTRDNSGGISLQNPRFGGWREDKVPKQCDFGALEERAR